MSHPTLERHEKKHKSPIPSRLDLDLIELDSPLLQGYLYKKSHIFENFNKRYFVLYTSCLVYYHKEEDFEKDLSHKNLKNRAGYFVLNRVYLSIPEKKPHGGRYSFILHTPDPVNKRRETFLVSKTREERNAWMKLIQEQNPFLVSPEQKVVPNSPLPERKRTQSTPTALSNLGSPVNGSGGTLTLPMSGLKLVPSFDEMALKVEEGHSDHEEHEPEDDESAISFKTSNDDDHMIEIPALVVT